MTSLLSNTKQMSNEIGYYMPLANLIGQVYGHVDVAGNTGTGGGTFSTASWAYWGSRATSSIGAAGAGILKDMGRTIVSSLRTFRKVQLVTTGPYGSNSTLSTFGVGGLSGSANGQDYYTGYIELGFEGNGTPAPVAHFGR